MNKKRDVEEEAFKFLSAVKEDILQALIDGIAIKWWCEGMQRWGAFSHSNDVWNETRSNDVWEEIEWQYEFLSSDFEPSWTVVDVDSKEIETLNDENDAYDSVARNDPDGSRGVRIVEGRGNIDELWEKYEKVTDLAINCGA